MQKVPGDPIPRITLPSIEDTEFDIQSLDGRPYLLSFFRFAGCPFCNLRMHQLVSRYGEIGEDFTMVAIFDSPLDNLKRYADRHSAPFPVLADEENRYYREFGIERSLIGVVKGLFIRMPGMLKALSKGFLPTTIKGSMTTMPADFLVDRQGVIRTAHYGTDEGDHLPLEQVIAFSHKA